MTIRQFAVTALRSIRDHRYYVLLGMLLSAFALLFANFAVQSQILGRAAFVLGAIPLVLAVVFDFVFDPVIPGIADVGLKPPAKPSTSEETDR
jgi:hypothetical protein